MVVTTRASTDSRARRRAWVWWLTRLSIAGVLLVLIGAWLAGSILMHPVQRVIDALPARLPAEEVALRSADGVVRGWFVPGRPDRGGVVLAHGLRGDRRHMLARARFLHAAGYTTLSIDLQAHGESEGDNITFGYRESRSVRSAVAFVRQRCAGHKVAVIGASLGGAACLLGETPIAADAYVLEAVYPTIDAAAANRVASVVGAWPAAALTPLLTMQCELRLGVSTERLRPIDGIARLNAPVFVIGGADDDRTLVAETRRMFDAARAPKQLWIVPGAGHWDLHGFAQTEYEARVLGFLGEHLGG